MPLARRATGQAMVEYLIVLPLLLLIILGTLQFALIYHAKITLNYATFEAVRAGSLNRMRDYAMEDALARGLAPLYTHGADIKDFKLARDKIRKQIKDGYVMLRVINPTTGDFSKFGVNENGKVYIPNDNLIYRGTPADPSGPTVQDANILKIQVHYCYQMIVPFVNRILWSMMRYAPSAAMPADLPEVKPEHRFGAPAPGTFAEECVKNKQDSDGYFGIPLNAQGIIRMQSPALRPGPPI